MMNHDLLVYSSDNFYFNHIYLSRSVLTICQRERGKREKAHCINISMFTDFNVATVILTTQYKVEYARCYTSPWKLNDQYSPAISLSYAPAVYRCQ